MKNDGHGYVLSIKVISTIELTLSRFCYINMKTKIISLFVVLFALMACGDRNTIRIATKPMTEQFILGEMLAQLIEENTGYKVEITKGIGGGTSNIHPALIKGDFDLYPEYTGTGWIVVLKQDSFPPRDKLYKILKKEYRDRYDLEWIAPYGFNNAYSLAVNQDNAKRYNLKKFSDLAKHPDTFTFGAEYDFFEIPQGYDELCKYYGLKFKSGKDMDIGLKYEAIKSGKIDVMNVFTTDGQLSGAGLVTLEDDRNFFPTYYCATVVRNDALKKYPGLESTLEKMGNLLSDREMSELNYQVDVKGHSEKDVAHEFLKKKGLLNKEDTNHE